ncbi:hypothetical protein [Thalassospira xiamenensis]|uniref:hypothetical protein n=1 Tax=Thalassospira xiamenensis TaxID=220697 RepID=UPI001FFF4EE7|nr:hypothetical protein [Thalassospira xiamenensis]MCK2166262.1 hypothetical protein [Thalassospira xiamenensis]
MTQNKGSKIALAVAGLLLVAGAATAIAMTQSESNNPASLFGTETGTENSDTMTPAPDAPAAETGEAPNTVLPNDNQEVPGMKGLDGNAGEDSSPLELMPQDDGGTTGGEAAPKTE